VNAVSTLLIAVGLFLGAGAYSFWKQELPRGVQVRPAEVGAAEIGAAQVRTSQVGQIQIRAAQVCTAQVGGPQVGTLQAGPAQGQFTEIGMIQTGVLQLDYVVAVADQIELVHQLERTPLVLPVQAEQHR
jgi:hypothetical protein